MTSNDRTEEPEWRQAARAAQAYFDELGIEARATWFEFIGEGLSYVAMASDVEVDGDFAGEIVVRLPTDEVEPGQPERALLERDIRQWLINENLAVGFRVPRVLHVHEAEWGLALVEEMAYGDPLDAVDEERWDSAGITVAVAAGLHGVPLEGIPEQVPRFSDRRAHALQWTSVLERGETPTFAAAREWCEENLPAPSAPSLLHGDLLGQNIILDIDDDFAEVRDVWLVDWEAVTLGDPAYDLAIFTRAYRRPLGTTTAEIVRRYNALAKHPVELAHVRIYELGLRASWYFEVVEDEGDSPHAQQREKDFNALFRRALKENPVV